MAGSHEWPGVAGAARSPDSTGGAGGRAGWRQARPCAIETATGKVASPNPNPLAQTRQRRALSKRTADAGGSSKRQSADAAPRCGCRPRGAAGRAVATMIASPRKRDRLTVDQRVIAIDGQRSSASAARRDRNATERDRAAPTTGSDRFYSLARVRRTIAKARGCRNIGAVWRV